MIWIFMLGFAFGWLVRVLCYSRRRGQPWDSSTYCKDCGASAGLGKDDMVVFYIHDELWNSIADTHDVLCFDCTQDRLDRTITVTDLKDCYLTRTMLLGIKIAEQTR